MVNPAESRCRYTWRPCGVVERCGVAKRVLIVDDSRVSRMMIKARLQALRPDWECLEAASGDECLANLDRLAPDFISMDMNMPGLNGFDTAEQVLARAPSVRLAMLTANIQDSSQARAKALGIRFVRKPVTDASIQELVQHFEATP